MSHLLVVVIILFDILLVPHTGCHSYNVIRHFLMIVSACFITNNAHTFKEHYLLVLSGSQKDSMN